jgi:hypothetical protein
MTDKKEPLDSVTEGHIGKTKSAAEQYKLGKISVAKVHTG